MSSSLYDRIYEVVSQVPPGTVATYGEIARVVGGGCDARVVGEALNVLPKERAQVVPWQRVINAQGSISTRGLLQHALLEQEGVVFEEGKTNLRRFGWQGPPPEWCAANGYTPLPPRQEPPAEQLSLF